MSKQIIDRKLNQDTVAIAFPYGTYNQEILDLCKKFGYKLGLSVKRGGNPFFTNPLTLNRSQLLKRDMDYFIKNLDTFLFGKGIHGFQLLDHGLACFFEI